MRVARARDLIRTIPDFPQPGIQFKDITPILADTAALSEIVRELTEWARSRDAQVIAGIESRGFLFGAPVALQLGIGFAPLRKPGKLPYESIREDYALEYGTNCIEMHVDAVAPGQRVVIIDDLLATGGTAAAAARLIERQKGVVAGLGFVIELGPLFGRRALQGYTVESLINYGEE